MAQRDTTELPREKLLRRGANALSDTELMALMLRSGIRDRNVLSLAERVIAAHDRAAELSQSPNRLSYGARNFDTVTLDPNLLATIKGVGVAKATTICAAQEFFRRRIRPVGFRISAPEDVLPLISHLADRRQEHFVAITLNGASEVIETRIVTIGLLNRTQVHPREVFAPAITDRAASLIVAHNHPSGNVEPSSDDIAITRRLDEVGELLGVTLLDHIIFTLAANFYSFRQHGHIS